MSASSLTGGTPAVLKGSTIPSYAARATLVAGGVGAQVVITPTFAVSDLTTVQFSPQGRAPAGDLYLTTANGAAGVGTITIQSANVADVGLTVSVQITSGASS